MLVVLNIAFIPLFVRALRIPYAVLMPLIIVFCITGAYSLNNKVWGTWGRCWCSASSATR
jgi:putative tricarboxylic transport membrane protein